MDAQDESRATFRTRRHRLTGELVLIRVVHGRATGSVIVLAGLPLDLFAIESGDAAVASGQAALHSTDYEDIAGTDA